MAHGKDGLFGWQILAEDKVSYMEFPIQASDKPVSDDEIKKLIRKTLIKNCTFVSADEIDNLVFIATNGDDAIIVEPLNPADYWPTFAVDELDSIYKKYRDTKGGE